MIGRISQFMCNVHDLTDNIPTKIIFPSEAKQYFHMPTINDGRHGLTMRDNCVTLSLECGRVTIEFRDENGCEEEN